MIAAIPIAVFTLSLAAPGDIVPLPLADVDWDEALEPLLYTPDAPGGPVYPWRAPRMKAQEVPRVEMGVDNLREIVYLRGMRVLDEGYWYGESPYEESRLIDALYDSRETYIDLITGDTITRWESEWAILRRTASIRGDGCVLRYHAWAKPVPDDVSAPPNLSATVGILWHDEPRAGTPKDALAYIIKRIREFNPGPSDCEGLPQIMDREIPVDLRPSGRGNDVNVEDTLLASAGETPGGLALEVRYSFDDTLKEVLIPQPPELSRTACIAWDGAAPPDFYYAGIKYEDARFSPLTGGLPWQEKGSSAIWGIVHVPAAGQPSSLLVETGRLVEGLWEGVGPGKKYDQLVRVLFGLPVPPEEFIRGDADGNRTVEKRDARAVEDYLFAGGKPACYDAADVNDDGVLTFEDLVYLVDYLQGGMAPPPPFPFPGLDPTKDTITCRTVEPPPETPPSPCFTLRLGRRPFTTPDDPAGAAPEVRFVLSKESICDMIVTQAHAAVSHRGMAFVGAYSLVRGFTVGAVPFPSPAIDRGQVGLTIYPVSIDPDPTGASGSVHLPDGPIVELVFRDPARTFTARLDWTVGADNLFFYTGVGLRGNPFIFAQRKTDLHFIRGDANASRMIEISDAIAIFGYLFGGGDLPCLDAADPDDSGRITIGDGIYILLYIFGHGRPPAPPFPNPGPDPTTDDLDCEAYPQHPQAWLPVSPS